MSSVHTLSALTLVPITFTPNACGANLPISQCIVPMQNEVQLVWTDIPATTTITGTDVPTSTVGTVFTSAIVPALAWPGPVSQCSDISTIAYAMATACFPGGTLVATVGSSTFAQAVVSGAQISSSEKTATVSSTSASSTSGAISTFASKGGSLSKGASVGLAFGCLIAGAVIAAVFACLFMRFKFRRRGNVSDINNNRYAPVIGNVSSGEFKSAPGVSVEHSNIGSIVDGHLPDEAADSVIISEFTKIDDKINNHVQSFFKNDSSRDYNALADATLREVENSLTLTRSQINKILATANNRTAVLRFLIGWVIITRMALESPSESSLLPPGIAQAIQSMTDIRSNDKVRMAFLAKWRIVTAFLMNITAAQTSSPPKAVPEINIKKVTTYINTIVAPYASHSEEDVTRLKNLEEIVRRAARVAAILFSQPALWNFDWANVGNGFVVFPALVKLTDSMGNVLKDPIIFGEKRIITT